MLKEIAVDKLIQGEKNMDLNGFSIVIASKGRVKLLEDLLISVKKARDNFQGPTEVLLIDDSNEEDSKKIVEICEKYDVTLINFGPSVSEKRNVGARKAQYDIVLFLDSDCIATPNLLNEHYKLYTDEKVGGVAGYLEFVGEDTWFWQAVDKTPFTICFSFPKWMETVPWTPTANCSIRKEVFEKINGFDRSFPDKPGGEDVDLGLRMTKAGYIFKCTADGLVYHSKKTWIPVKAMIKRLWHYGAANYYLTDKHPDYVMEIMPRKSSLYLTGILATLLLALVTLNPWTLISVPVWIIADIMLSAIFINKFASYKGTSFLKQCVVQLLILDNELGYVWTCIKKKKPGYINKDVVYFDGQMDGIQDTSSIMTWCNMLSFAILICLSLILMICL